MQGRRILVFIVVFLVTLPIVTATADGAEKARDDGLIIRLGELHEGERFVYDLHLTSEYRELDVHVPGFLDIRIERIQDFEALDGTVHDVVATHVHQKTEAWNHLPGMQAHSIRNETQYLRTADGVYLERQEEARGTTWVEHEAESEERRSHRAGRIAGEGNGGDLYGRGLHPGSGYVHGNKVQQILTEMVSDVHGQVQDAAEWQGQTVYDVYGAEWTTHDASAAFRCSSQHPEYDYQDHAARMELDGRRFTEHMSVHTWARPGIAFPVLNECHATYHDGDHLFERVTLKLELTHHEPGGEVIRVDWDRRNERDNYRPVGTLTPTPSVFPGVPSGTERLGVPLEQAVDLVRASTDRDLQRWRDDGPMPFWLVGANYYPAIQKTRVYETEGPTGPVPTPVPVGVPSDPTNPAQPEEPDRLETQRVAVTWHLHLANRAGESRDVSIRFDENEEGVFDAGAIQSIGQVPDVDPWVEGRLATDYAALDQVVDLFLANSGVDRSRWLHNEQDSVGIENRIIDDGDRGYRAHFEVTLSAKDPAAPEMDERGRRVVHAYDARDGSPVRAGNQESWIVGQSSAPPAPAYGPASAEGPRVVARFPAAATASGFALAAGFAVAFFWDAVARTFGQFVAAPLYAKIRKDKVLDHRTRDLIVTTVQENPGIAVEQLRREVAVGYGTVCHHLDTLQRNGLVTSRKVGRRRCYFVPGALDANEMAAVGLAGTPAAARLLTIVHAEPGLTQSEIATRLGVADSSVRYQAKRLLAHARLRAEREGRTVRYYPGEQAAA